MRWGKLLANFSVSGAALEREEEKDGGEKIARRHDEGTFLPGSEEHAEKDSIAEAKMISNFHRLVEQGERGLW